MKLNLDTIIEKDAKYHVNTYGKRSSLCLTHGEGIYLYDSAGKKYTDLLGGIAVNILGHAHPSLLAALNQQASLLMHCSNLYYNAPQTLLAEKLIEMSGDMEKVFFTNSGAEANEAALKLARAYFYKQGKPRKKIFTAKNSFHGRTLATVTATGQEKYNLPFGPLPEGFEYLPFNNIKALDALDENTCALMLEVIQGESGVWPASQEYMEAAKKACERSGALLIIDEIQTGMGRTGSFYAYEHYGIAPDIVTLAKGLGGGFPIGAMLASDRVASAFSLGDHGTTFGGNPLACALSLAVLEEIEKHKLISSNKSLGTLFMEKLEAAAGKCQQIREIRGRGLMIAIGLSEKIAPQVKDELMDKGFLVNSVGEDILRLLPPYIIKEKDIDKFIDALLELLKAH